MITRAATVKLDAGNARGCPFRAHKDLTTPDPDLDIARAGLRWNLRQGFRNIVGSYAFVYHGPNGKGAMLSISKRDGAGEDIIIGEGQTKRLTLPGGEDVVELKLLDHTRLAALVSISLKEGEGRTSDPQRD